MIHKSSIGISIITGCNLRNVNHPSSRTNQHSALSADVEISCSCHKSQSWSFACPCTATPIIFSRRIAVSIFIRPYRWLSSYSLSLITARVTHTPAEVMVVQFCVAAERGKSCIASLQPNYHKFSKMDYHRVKFERMARPWISVALLVLGM